jgi:hypothetical protein
MKPHIKLTDGRWGYTSSPGRKWEVRLAHAFCRDRNRAEGRL